MDTPTALGLIGLVVAILVGVVALATYRRQFPKRQIRYASMLAPLLNLTHEGLEVSFRGEPVKDPHLATVWLRSASRADIPSSAFDDRKPIVFRFDQRVIGVSSQAAQDIEWVVEGSELRIVPQLLHPGSTLEISLVVEGKSGGYEMDSPLIDIPLVQSRALVAPGSRLLLGLLIAASSMSVVVAGLLVVAFALNVF